MRRINKILSVFLITAMIINSVISVYGESQIHVTENISAQESVARISEKSQQHQKKGRKILSSSSSKRILTAKRS